jgi:hypothetical protein
MEPIAIVKKRSRLWLLMIVLILAAILIAAALWFLSDGAVTAVSRAPASTSSIIEGLPAVGNPLS